MSDLYKQHQFTPSAEALREMFGLPPEPRFCISDIPAQEIHYHGCLHCEIQIICTQPRCDRRVGTCVDCVRRRASSPSRELARQALAERQRRLEEEQADGLLRQLNDYAMLLPIEKLRAVVAGAAALASAEME